METTYATKAIVLYSIAHKESDSKVVFYTQAKGKLELVARGSKKPGSKLAGHLEPFNLIDLMVINGRGRDYAGAAASVDCFLTLKQDLAKLQAASQVFSWLNSNFKAAEPDPQAFGILANFLQLLNQVKSEPLYYELLASVAILQLLVSQGQQPNLHTCVICQQTIVNQHLRFDLVNGGAVCLGCQPQQHGLTMELSADCVQALESIMRQPFAQLIARLRPSRSQAQAINAARDNFVKIFA